MLPAASIPALKRRMDDYVWREEGVPMMRLRILLRERFLPLGPVAIVGGLVRDMARKGKVGFSSDVDLVVDAPAANVAELARELGAKPNRFGGYSTVHPHWKVDFWALGSTWAAAVGLVDVTSLADVVRTTFFDCDAVCYEIRARRIHALPDYLHRLGSRQLDINLLPNPSIDGNLLRSARRLLLWGYHPGPALREFIRRELNEESFRRIVTTEAEIYRGAILGVFDSAAHLAEALLEGVSASSFPAFGLQLELPGLDDA